MNLTEIVSKASNYIHTHKETCLYGAGAIAAAADALLTYYGSNGDASYEFINRARDLMYEYGVGPALLISYTKEAVLIAGAIFGGQMIKKSNKAKFEQVGGNILSYGAPAYWCMIHSLGTLSHFYDVTPIAKIWNIF